MTVNLKISVSIDIDLCVIIKCMRIIGYDGLSILKLHQVTLSSDAVKSITGLFDTRKYAISVLEIMDCYFTSPDLIQCLLYRKGIRMHLETDTYLETNVETTETVSYELPALFFLHFSSHVSTNQQQLKHETTTHLPMIKTARKIKQFTHTVFQSLFAQHVPIIKHTSFL